MGEARWQLLYGSGMIHSGIVMPLCRSRPQPIVATACLTMVTWCACTRHTLARPDAMPPDSAGGSAEVAMPTADGPPVSEDAATQPMDLAAPPGDTLVPPTPPPCKALCSSVAPSYPTNEPWGGLGNATMYSTSASAGGACQYGTTQIRYFAAISVNLQPNDGKGAWQNGRICGQCAEVLAQTSKGPRTLVVRIMDKCPDGYCGIDLGGDAPAALMADDFGRYDGRWRWVPCTGHPETFDGPTTLYVKSGSNAWWSRIQIRNPPMGILSMAWRPSDSASAFEELVFAEGNLENFYSVPAKLLQSPSQVEILIRYNDGTSATLSIAGTDLAKEDASYPVP